MTTLKNLLNRLLRFVPTISTLYNVPIRFKILLIVGAGIGGFAIFLIVNYMVTTENSNRLHAARSVYFPVLEKLDTIPGRMERLVDAINTASLNKDASSVERISSAANMVKESVKFVEEKDTLNAISRERLNKSFNEMQQETTAYAQLLLANTDPEEVAKKKELLDGKIKQFETTTNGYRKFAFGRFTSLIAETDNTSREILKVGVVIYVIVALVLLITGYVVQSLITTSVVDVNRTLEDMVSGQGDLTKRLQSKGDDEIGDLVYWFNAFVARLDSIVGDAVSSANQVDQISFQMSEFNSALLKRAEHLKSELQDASNAVKLMLITVGKNEVDANETDGIAAHAANSAKAGRQVMADLNKAIGEISVSSEKINEMVSAIDGIAFQTNLLALNAAVEAARAGDQGRGFAVVAGEVRSLAQRASTTAKEIKDVIKDSTNKVYAGVRLADESNVALEELYDAARKAAELNARIAKSSGEQSSDIENIAKVMNEVDRLTQESSHDILESTQASKVLANQSERLAKLMKFFKVSAHADDREGNTALSGREADGHRLKQPGS